MADDMITADFVKTIQTFSDDGLLGGVFLAVPTGEVMEDDPTFIEVLIYGKSVYAKPCLGFGSYSVPTKEWLNKHKNEVLVWVAFENGNPAHPVYLGVCPTDKKTPENKTPEGFYWKSVDFVYNLSDKDRKFSFTHNNKNVMKYEEMSGISFLSGNEVAVKGNTLGTFLQKFINIVMSAQTMTTQDTLSVATITQLAQLQAEIENIKSKKIKIE